MLINRQERSAKYSVEKTLLKTSCLETSFLYVSDIYTLFSYNTTYRVDIG